jgi:hypothetical protein
MDTAPPNFVASIAAKKMDDDQQAPRAIAASAMDLLQRTSLFLDERLCVSRRESPMDLCMHVLLVALPLTSAGRPALFGNEVEIYSEENISLYDHANKTPFQRGRCSITTHRLFYLDETKNPPLAMFLPLEWVTKLSKEAGFLARSGVFIRRFFELHVRQYGDENC